MYNIITLKGELMKKLFILTILLSATNLGAFTQGEAHGVLSSAQLERNAGLNKAKEYEAAVKHAFALAQAKPGPESYQALQDAIATHGEVVDHCAQCVQGIQRALNTINAKGHHVHGDAFSGKVHTPTTRTGSLSAVRASINR